jgi:hypothetical protein
MALAQERQRDGAVLRLGDAKAFSAELFAGRHRERGIVLDVKNVDFRGRGRHELFLHEGTSGANRLHFACPKSVGCARISRILPRAFPGRLRRVPEDCKMQAATFATFATRL